MKSWKPAVARRPPYNAAGGEVCNAKNDSVAYCDTTRPEQHEYWLGLLF
jgi:hypothetical protein